MVSCPLKDEGIQGGCLVHSELWMCQVEIGGKERMLKNDYKRPVDEMFPG